MTSLLYDYLELRNMLTQDPYNAYYMHELMFVNSFLMFYDKFFTKQLK